MKLRIPTEDFDLWDFLLSARCSTFLAQMHRECSLPLYTKPS